MFDTLIEALIGFVRNYPEWSLAILFAIGFVESLVLVGVVVPGTLILFGIGALVGAGHLSLTSAIIALSLGGFVGDVFSFWLGRQLERWPRVHAYLENHAEGWQAAHGFFERYGLIAIFIGRFFGPLRATLPSIAGLVGMKFRDFLIASTLGCVLWAPVYLIPGVLFGEALDAAGPAAQRLLLALVVVALLLFALRWLWHRHGAGLVASKVQRDAILAAVVIVVFAAAVLGFVRSSGCTTVGECLRSALASSVPEQATVDQS